MNALLTSLKTKSGVFGLVLTLLPVIYMFMTGDVSGLQLAVPTSQPADGTSAISAELVTALGVIIIAIRTATTELKTLIDERLPKK